MVLGLAEYQSPRGTEGSRWRLGAWASSEEEPKLKRGSRNNFTVFLGTRFVKTLKPSRKVKGKRGASNQ
jgi:hypothetical protein